MLQLITCVCVGYTRAAMCVITPRMLPWVLAWVLAGPISVMATQGFCLRTSLRSLTSSLHPPEGAAIPYSVPGIPTNLMAATDWLFTYTPPLGLHFTEGNGVNSGVLQCGSIVAHSFCLARIFILIATETSINYCSAAKCRNRNKLW